MKRLTTSLLAVVSIIALVFTNCGTFRVPKALADSGVFSATITISCSSGTQTIATVHAGDQVTGLAVLLSNDPNENGEGEPLHLSGPGLSFSLPDYSQHTPFGFTANGDGSIQGCITNAENDETGNVTVGVNQGDRQLLTKDQKDALGHAGTAGYVGGAGLAAGGLIVGVLCIPCGIAIGIFGIATAGVGYGADKLAADPPDPNYKVIATPVTPRLTQQPLTAGQGFTQQEADASNALLTNYEVSIGLQRAMLTSLNRYSGAYNAGDTYWEGQQEQAARLYAGQLATQIEAEPNLLTNLQDAFQAAGVTAMITPGDVSNFESNLNTNGLPASSAQILTQLGFDSSEQNDITQALIVQDTNQVAALGGGNFPKMLTDPFLITALQNEAQALNQFAGTQPGPGPGPTATPELSSADLLTISLFPLGLIWLTRRRRARRDAQK